MKESKTANNSYNLLLRNFLIVNLAQLIIFGQHRKVLAYFPATKS